MWSRIATIPLFLLLTGCGSAPTAPSPQPRPAPAPVPAPAPSVVTIRGTITDTLSGAPSGTFSQDVARLPAFITVQAAGFLTRQLQVTSATPTVDLIRNVAPFDLAFYRQFVRNGFEAPSQLEPLRRQTQAPRIYIRTIDQAGAPIDTAVVSSLERVIRTSPIIESFTGGVFGLAALESGPSTREGVAGWITIRWVSQSPSNIGCGHGQIGGTWIELTNHPSCGGCPGVLNTFPRLVKHEIGHALGFWHTDDRNDVMYPASTVDCDNNPSPRERTHGGIAYRRPVGNRDVDSDPVTSGLSVSRMILD